MRKYEKEVLSMKKYIQNVIDFIFDIIQMVLFRFFRIVDKGHLSRRLAVWASIIITVQSAYWCMGLVSAPPAAYTGTDVAAIIAAVMAPLAALTAALMKFGEQYKDKKRVEETDINDGGSV